MPDKVEDPCQECRERHLKCDDRHPKCRQCERLGSKCHRGKGQLKIRPGSSARLDTTFPKDQPWLIHIKNGIQFVDQGPELENAYSLDDLLVNGAKAVLPDHRLDGARSLGQQRVPGAPLGLDRSPTLPSSATSDTASLVSSSTIGDECLPEWSPLKRRRTADAAVDPQLAAELREHWPKVAYDPIRSAYRIYDNDPKRFVHALAHGYPYMSAAPPHSVPKVVEAEYRRMADSEAAFIPAESLLAPAIWKEEFFWPNVWTTTQCACLMRYYIECIAPSFDVGDPARHFTLTVPQRARRCPPLLNAIFTAAARHLASLARYRTADGVVKYQDVLLPNLTDKTALRYHNACIAYLKKLSTDPEHVSDENLLAAAVILRYYEEIDTSITGEDRESFGGTFQVLVKAQAQPYALLFEGANSPDDVRRGVTGHGRDSVLEYLRSFQHAAFRVALRQETTIAFLKQRPVRLPLERWAILDGYDEAEDFIWADRHLHFCAKVLQFAFGGEFTSPQAHLDRWNQLHAMDAQWNHVKPLSFSPIYYQDPDRAKGECFPQIWHMAELHVVGLLFLELARILLTLYNPNLRRVGHGAAAAHRHAHHEVHEILVRLCGTATSAAASQPAMVQAYMAIAVWGEHIADPVEQRALLAILDRLKRDHGWPTGKTAMELKKEWCL